MCIECERKDKIIAVQAAEIERLRALESDRARKLKHFDFMAGVYFHDSPPFHLVPGFPTDEETT